MIQNAFMFLLVLVVYVYSYVTNSTLLFILFGNYNQAGVYLLLANENWAVSALDRPGSVVMSMLMRKPAEKLPNRRWLRLICVVVCILFPSDWSR